MVLDAMTLDCLTEFRFKNYGAKRRWIHLIDHEYFDDPDVEITVDFARRFAKLMQFLLKQPNLSNFQDIVCDCAKEANIEKKVRKYHAEKSITLLIETWMYGDALKAYINQYGKDEILNLF